MAFSDKVYCSARASPPLHIWFLISGALVRRRRRLLHPRPDRLGLPSPKRGTVRSLAVPWHPFTLGIPKAQWHSWLAPALLFHLSPDHVSRSSAPKGGGEDAGVGVGQAASGAGLTSPLNVSALHMDPYAELDLVCMPCQIPFFFLPYL